MKADAWENKLCSRDRSCVLINLYLVPISGLMV